MSRKLRVFLCHATQDKPTVRELYNALELEGWIDPWLDKAKILPGQDWRVVIEKAVEEADVVVACLSCQSVNKEGFVQREIKYACDMALEKPEETIFLIPLRLEDCVVPRGLRSLQWANYFGSEKEDTYSDLLAALKLRYNQKLELETEETERQQAEEHARREARELARKLAAEKTAREEIEREAAELAAREKREREAKKKAKREKDEREAKEKIAREEKLAPVSRSDIPTKDRIATSYSKSNPTYANLRLLGIGGVILFALIFGGFGLNYLINHFPVATATPPSLATATFKPPTLTSIPFTSTPQPTETLIPTPALGIGSTEISLKDGMTLLYVPAGEFAMGSDSNSNEQPIHQVTLNAFWVDQTEVTNKMYSLCVTADVCKEPSYKGSYTRSSYYGNPEFDNYPVIYVDWNKAKTYCEWAGRRLPTEAQWEKAARGPNANIYPWGNIAPTKDLLNYNSIVGDTTTVGNYPNGKSFYGAYDMAGNVWEWANEWYGETYYQSSNSSNNPLGPESGQYRLVRGGSWDNHASNVRSASRHVVGQLFTDFSFGFRCSRLP